MHEKKTNNRYIHFLHHIMHHYNHKNYTIKENKRAVGQNHISKLRER